MKARMEDGRLILSVSGHVDSANAAAVEAELMSELGGREHAGLTLDLEELEYISSAGLRVILRLRKLEPELRLVNVGQEVYEILSMTGFTEMMPVEKAFRRLSVEGCEAIGRGANGTVYRIDKDTVVKVYRNGDCLPEVRRERELARKAFVLGIPTAIPYDVVRVGDSYGSVFELLNSKSFTKLLRAEPGRMDEFASSYVEVMRKLHSTRLEPGEMPSMKETALAWEDYVRKGLPSESADKFMALLNGIPEQNTLLHGDYHTNNVVVQNEEVLIIDMDTLCLGHPIFELAFMWLAYVGFGELDKKVCEDFFNLPSELLGSFWAKSLSLYLGTEDEERLRSVEDKAKVIGYVRLMRRTMKRGSMDNAFDRATLEHCRSRLVELLPSVDTLCF